MPDYDSIMPYKPRSILQISLLQTVSRQPCNAYQAYRELSRVQSEHTAPSYQAVHRCLTALHDKGFVESVKGTGYVRYQLSALGRRFLTEEHTWFQRIEERLRADLMT